MKKICLTQGKYALIDDEDLERVNNIKWHFDGRYAAHKNRVKIYLHRFIMNFPKNKIDHIDMNRLNCQKNNLREATPQGNGANRLSNRNNKSGVKGVYLMVDKPRTKPWTAQIKVNYKSISLGVYSTKEEAGKAYREASLKHFGKFARA